MTRSRRKPKKCIMATHKGKIQEVFCVTGLKQNKKLKEIEKIWKKLGFSIEKNWQDVYDRKTGTWGLKKKKK